MNGNKMNKKLTKTTNSPTWSKDERRKSRGNASQNIGKMNRNKQIKSNDKNNVNVDVNDNDRKENDHDNRCTNNTEIRIKCAVMRRRIMEAER